jgi:hypothetical protein
LLEVVAIRRKNAGQESYSSRILNRRGGSNLQGVYIASPN